MASRLATLFPAFLAVLAASLVLASAAAAADFKPGDRVEVKWRGKWFAAEVLEAKKGKWKVHYQGYDAEWDEWVGAARVRAPKTSTVSAGGAAATDAPAAGTDRRPAGRAGGPAGISSLKKGDKVEMEFRGAWYPATVVEAPGNGTVRVHPDGWADSWKEDVGPDRLRSLPTPPPPPPAVQGAGGSSSGASSAQRAPGSGWQKGDKVSVEYRGDWHAATVLDGPKDDKDESGKPVRLWRIHFDGWADSWDDWVPKERIKNR